MNTTKKQIQEVKDKIELLQLKKQLEELKKDKWRPSLRLSDLANGPISG